MQDIEDLTKGVPQTMKTNDLNSRERMEEAQDNLSIFINNIILYCQLVQHQQIDGKGAGELVELLRRQLNQLWFEETLKRFSNEFKIEVEGELEPFEKKLYELEQIIRANNQQKNGASSESKNLAYENEMNRYMDHLEIILGSENIKKEIEYYQIYEDSQQIEVSKQPSQIDIPSTHFFKELINTNISYGPAVFSFVRPENHQFYITQAAKTYSQIAPFKIKTITLSISDGPVINIPNFFEKDLDESKAILSVCVEGSKKLGFYSLADVCKVHTVGKQYYQERQLANEWNFSASTRSVITPSGKIFAVNCRTSKEKIDPYLYEITESKASNRGPLIAPKRDSSILYMNGCIYLIGGRGQGQKCSKKNYRYTLKEKKWQQICESNVGLRKATVCVVNNRYICKLGGLNEFDYINKVIEMYDSLTDRWSLVRASPRNILEEVQILEDSHAVQINDDQIYVFGGQNSNKFNTDTGFVLLISEIRERRKGAAKVSGQFWNVSVGKKNILTFFGQFYASSVIIHHNCIYGLRTEVSKALSV